MFILIGLLSQKTSYISVCQEIRRNSSSVLYERNEQASVTCPFDVHTKTKSTYFPKGVFKIQIWFLIMSSHWVVYYLNVSCCYTQMQKALLRNHIQKKRRKNGVHKEIKQTLIFFLVLFHTPKILYKIQRWNTLSARMQAFNTFFLFQAKQWTSTRSTQKWGHPR